MVVEAPNPRQQAEARDPVFLLELKHPYGFVEAPVIRPPLVPGGDAIYGFVDWVVVLVEGSLASAPVVACGNVEELGVEVLAEGSRPRR